MKLSDLSSRKIHIIGINGIGMSALAIYLKNNKFDVSGSDITYNTNTVNLEKHKRWKISEWNKLIYKLNKENKFNIHIIYTENEKCIYDNLFYKY